MKPWLLQFNHWRKCLNWNEITKKEKQNIIDTKKNSMLDDRDSYIKDLEIRLLDLQQQNEKLRLNATEVFIEEMVVRNGTFETTMNTGIGPVLCEFIDEIMRSTNAENFVTFQMHFGNGKQSYYITAGKSAGKSVDEKYAEVKNRCDDVENCLEKISEETDLNEIKRLVSRALYTGG